MILGFALDFHSSFPSSLSKTWSFTELENLFLLLHNFSDSTAVTPHLAGTSVVETEMAWGPQPETETSLPWPGEHLPLILGNARERTCIIPKPTFFGYWTIWWRSLLPCSHLAWLIVICQVDLGPEELPDWVIFSEKRCKAEGFRCAFSMNHKLQASGPKWGTCLPTNGSVEKPGLDVASLGLSHFQGEFGTCEFLVLILGIFTKSLGWIHSNIYSTKNCWALKQTDMVLAV